jgi:hypothetical protein
VLALSAALDVEELEELKHAPPAAEVTLRALVEDRLGGSVNSFDLTLWVSANVRLTAIEW